MYNYCEIIFIFVGHNFRGFMKMGKFFGGCNFVG